ncbi:hypothetical protein K461DRAFT_140358 [Myriangium duriaei CBS 260.36]|uniref:DUF7587 domain-containing protein n=1 Tax=Myriangium duriaei CBS 260.36 TaxID=1168546 RepID=A0A9P4MN70_9PEZI|nr:hypothetical protein K461DRAFT_140358 [Myriangium duriaei CBS 260.36]
MRLMNDYDRSFEETLITLESHLTISLHVMAVPRRRTEQKINWTTETRIGLLAAALLTGSQWNDVRDLWWDEFADHAPGHSRNGRLKACLCSQHAMIKRSSGANTWGQVGRTLPELEIQAPELVQRLRAACTALGYGQTSGASRFPGFSAQAMSTNSSAVVTDTAPASDSMELTEPQVRSMAATHPPRPENPTGSRTDSMYSVFSVATPSSRLGLISRPKLSSTTATVSSPLPPRQEHHPDSTTTSQTNNRYPRRPSGQNTDDYLSQVRSMEHGALREVPFDVAHPPLPVLFYRYYTTANTHVGNYPNERGFISGLYNGPTIHQGFGNPLDSSEAFLFHLIEVHVNQRKHPPTPFVSVSTNLHWVVTTAAMKHHNGEEMRISIIDAAAAAGTDRSRAYHVQAYYDQLRERAAFDDFAKMMYRGKVSDGRVISWARKQCH